MFFEVVGTFFYIIFELLILFVKLIIDSISIYFSISKLLNITSPLGIILVDYGVPISLLGFVMFLLKVMYKKAKG